MLAAQFEGSSWNSTRVCEWYEWGCGRRAELLILVQVVGEDAGNHFLPSA